MKYEQQQQAESLYFQTDLSKTQIAETLRVSRRTIHYWIRENNWDQLKKSAACMPSLLAHNCYQVMAQLSEHILSPERNAKPATREEVDSLYKLTMTINKLNARSVLNESVEAFTGFLEDLHSTDADLAEGIRPLVSRYLSSRAGINTGQFRTEKIPNPAPRSTEQDFREAELDKEDLLAWKQNANPSPRPNANPKSTAKSNTTTASPLECMAPSPLERAGERSPLADTGSAERPKFDIRKQLRGTATSGPGKAFHKQNTRPDVAA